MRLFFYCSGPSTGLVLKEIDYETGRSKWDQEIGAKNQMTPESFAIMNNGDSKMALFYAGNRCCFVAKGVTSETAGRNGRLKLMSVAFESETEQGTIRRIAAKALLDYKNFSRELTDCVKISSGPAAYSVKPELLHRFLEPFRTPLHLPESDERSALWDELTEEKDILPYLYLVMNTSLSYFNRCTNLNVPETQIMHIFKESMLENGGAPLIFREKPASEKAFTSEARADTPQDGDTVQNAGRMTPEHEMRDDGGKKTGASQAAQAGAQKTGSLIREESKNGISGQTAGESETEKIDLLDYPAFRVGAGAVLLLAVILIVYIVWQFIN